MSLCADYEYLCKAVDKAGWLIGLTLSAKKTRRTPDGPIPELGYIRLRRNPTAAAGIAIEVDGDLARASRAALQLLVARVKT